MGSGSGENVGSVLAGAVGKGLNFAGQNLIPFKQQQEENLLKNQLAELQFESAERDKLMFEARQIREDQAFKMGALNLEMKTAEAIEKAEWAAMTDDQKAEKEVEKLRAGVQAFFGGDFAGPYANDLMGDFQMAQDRAPEGYDFDLGKMGLVREPVQKQVQSKTPSRDELIIHNFGVKGWMDYTAKRGPWKPRDKQSPEFDGLPISHNDLFEMWLEDSESRAFMAEYSDEEVVLPTFDEYVANIKQMYGMDEADDLLKKAETK